MTESRGSTSPRGPCIMEIQPSKGDQHDVRACDLVFHPGGALPTFSEVLAGGPLTAAFMILTRRDSMRLARTSMVALAALALAAAASAATNTYPSTDTPKPVPVSGTAGDMEPSIITVPGTD